MDLFLHPGNVFPFIVKVILDATVTVAVITTAVRYVAVVADEGSAKLLNAEVSTTSVIVIVIDCVPAFPVVSVAVRVKL